MNIQGSNFRPNYGLYGNGNNLGGNAPLGDNQKLLQGSGTGDGFVRQTPSSGENQIETSEGTENAQATTESNIGKFFKNLFKGIGKLFHREDKYKNYKITLVDTEIGISDGKGHYRQIN